MEAEEAPLLLCLAPAYQADFQQGTLGQNEAKLVGELQAKQVDANARADRVEVYFEGEEVVLSGGPAAEAESSSAAQHREFLELHRQRRIVWEADSSAEELPATLPFTLDLTADLPHCIHLSQSSLSYRLRAVVTFSNPTLAPVSCTAPVHLTRYGAPSFTSFDSDAPCRQALDHPTHVELLMPKCRFRKSEPIPLRVRIPPPESSLVQDKGLHLRSVTAELVRTISSTANVSKVATICRTGKSCRFSSNRPLSLRLTLPPRFEEDVGCEAITQDTIFHSISFSVKLTIAMSGRTPSDRHDFTLIMPVGVMPDLYTRAKTSEKQREATAFLTDYLEQVPTYRESEGPSSSSAAAAAGALYEAPTGSTPAPDLQAAAAEAGWSYDSDEEPEYDGFEETSALEADSLEQPPPAISEDVSPPNLSLEGTSMDAHHPSSQPSIVVSRSNQSGQPFVFDPAIIDAAPQELPLPPSPPRTTPVQPHPAAALVEAAFAAEDGSSSEGGSAGRHVDHLQSAVQEGEADPPPPSYRDGNAANEMVVPMMLHMPVSPAAGPPPYSM